uniref:SGNH hydrolase-type esterase domain-containing protein n=1 Tax=Chromera velia CCMP2878 TaxID=1169474 RepID=A0A0G4HUF4_9ALVE|mmetsp:Transcript_33366/g.66161  ORF Transcript_33366/g.66161 Transcript_33366/m.66161 type:complete len:350 (-) Transcript_33366:233-1282(-)|eukprot:Cvel_8643.t1-p1 / transcript=Cvel_8643.t1 / gene=Cvel_8643 / organism=Chromera_velia_CCMP2878 / gene_product=hypothetical protein / transcript_product=hypothetical protein / location=Cvel_scaffold481:73082-74128(-) / protein_length=349 / sequence_SO=supercontig / SO=protein_coding / is_pseudo=false
MLKTLSLAGVVGTVLGAAEKIRSQEFYAHWSGHEVAHLNAVIGHVRSATSDAAVLWLAGDSALDNKFWLSPNNPTNVHKYSRDAENAFHTDPLTDPSYTAEALNGYEGVLEGRMVRDVTYNLNAQASSRKMSLVTVNTAVEASTLEGREVSLLDADEVIRDNIQPQDVLVVHVGANDILFSTGGGLPSPEKLQEIFLVRLKNFVERLTEKTKPSLVVLCGTYYPGLEGGRSWATEALDALGYSKEGDPSILKGLVDQVFTNFVSRVEVGGVKVVPLQLSAALDGSEEGAYVQRVEPSVQGGGKLAGLILDLVEKEKENAVSEETGAEEESEKETPSLRGTASGPTMVLS